jgi:hypothetical protein
MRRFFPQEGDELVGRVGGGGEVMHVDVLGAVVGEIGGVGAHPAQGLKA